MMEKKVIKVSYFAKQLFETCSYVFKASYFPILASWGFRNLKNVFNSDSDYFVQFVVNGKKYQGRIRILYNEGLDLFVIQLVDDSLIKQVDEVYISELITILDNLIETDN